MRHTPESLIAFEHHIAELFNAGQIRAPIHLSGGNEKELIRIFDDIEPEDWIATTWRSHYHCLLKGVPPEVLKRDILDGKSITLTYPYYRIISSAIVGGVIPIALGIAWAIKRKGGDQKVWVFVGDMTAWTGIFHECMRYVGGHGLPLHFIVEDNGLSVGTDTRRVCGTERWHGDLRAYDYKLPWPHAGAGKRINF